METQVTINKQLQTLHQEGRSLAEEFGAEQLEREELYDKQEPKKRAQPMKVVIMRIGKEEEEEKSKEEPAPEPIPPEKIQFEERYQRWYSITLPLMKKLAPERLAEFQSYYQPAAKRGPLDGYNYVIQDWIRREAPDEDCEVATWAATHRCFVNQLNILGSIKDRLEWESRGTENHAERGLQLALLETARGLLDVDHRAAGALAGTVLEAYLRKLALKHQVRLRKQTASPGEMVEALKTAKVLDVPAWSQATWLAEIHARCLAKGEPPTKLQVRDLIDGCLWLIANVF